MTPPATGQPIRRLDGRLKVTGAATYAAEFDRPGLVHGVIVDSTIGRGRIIAVDPAAALALPGVLTVISHLNAPRLPYREYRRPPTDPERGERLHVFQDASVKFFGQPVAVVVAETPEIARQAARLVEVRYVAEPVVAGLDDATGPAAYEPVRIGGTERGSADRALAAAPVRLDHTYRVQRQHHNPMEPHATIAEWAGDQLTVWEKSQWVQNTAAQLAAVFGLPEDAVRCVSPFVGGAFGNALRAWPHATVAALAARELGRPVKVVLSRRQLYSGAGFRAASDHRIAVGSTAEGRLTALVHEVRAETSSYEVLWETQLPAGQAVYSIPNLRNSYLAQPVDVNTPTFMRGPGIAPAAFALESALDELAVELGLDPITVRLRNEPERDESNGRPYSSRRLPECYELGRREFGWDRWDRAPRSHRSGHRLLGTGMASAYYETYRSLAEAVARLDADGSAVIQSATSDMGPGTYTSVAQVAADALGLPVAAVRVELGDSRLPPAPGHSASRTMASVGSAAELAAHNLRDTAIRLAVADPESPLYGLLPEAVAAADGRLFDRADQQRGETYQALMARRKLESLTGRGRYEPANGNRFSMWAFGAVFAEVAVDERLGTVRVRRMLGVYDAGRIVNPLLAESQSIGGMVGGLGMALLEHTVTDSRDGRPVNANLADYLVPVHADIPVMKAIYLDGDDRLADPIGVKGLGELTICGVAPAIANAVFNATGRRVRQLPITIEALS